MKAALRRAPESDLLAQAHGWAAIVAAGASAASVLAGAVGKLDAAPYPFIWRDVALVCFVSALPLAASLAVAWQLRFSLSKKVIVVIALEALALLGIPRLYIHARSQRDLGAIRALIEQSRLGQAQSLAGRVLALSPRAVVNGFPLQRLADDLSKAVRQLESHAAAPLAAAATDEDRYRRARALAMLSRTAEAIAVLESSASLTNAAEACNLRGTMFETEDNWRAARDWYARGSAAWRSRSESPERTAGLVQASTGMGYCERKLGHLHEADAAFQEILRLAPTAESHFLLAQFYEDTQQAAKAQVHARQAALMEPQKFARQADQLIDKLESSHFGCLSVFAAKNSDFPPTTTLSNNR
jgi:tetratricopeptide (TPR) repeat protein